MYRRRAGTRSAIDGASLSAAKVAELINEIKAQPYLFVGQEKIGFSDIPSWVDNHMQPSQTLIRSFLIQKNDSFRVMPGGLTRTSFVKDSFIISNQTGGKSKDTWVLTTGEESTLPLPFQLTKNRFSEMIQKDSLPSHTAENLYWVGRYTERLINNARLLRTVMQFTLQKQQSG
jgi:hypothetical protein